MNNLTNSNQSRLRVMWRLSWPSILEQLLGTLVSYVDTAMVGVLGAAATAAVSVNASPIWLVGGILSGAGVGYSVQVANAVGARDEIRARRVIVQALLAALIIGFGFLALLQLLAGAIPLWMGAKPEVLPLAASYLRFYTLCMPGHAMLYVFSAVLRCTGDTKTPLLLNSSCNLLNAVLNFFLIYLTRELTLFGTSFTMPGAGMGVAGAAAASAIAIDLAGVLLLVVLLRRFHLFQRGTGDSLRPDRVIIRTAASLGLPYIAERMSINLGQITMTRVVASIGTAALAAHHIANTAEGLCYLPAYGISAAATALVGQSVGAQKKRTPGHTASSQESWALHCAWAPRRSCFSGRGCWPDCSRRTRRSWSWPPQCCASSRSPSRSSPFPSCCSARCGVPTTPGTPCSPACSPCGWCESC